MRGSNCATTGLAVVLLVSAISPEARAYDEPTPTPLDGLGTNVIDSFTGTNLWFYGGAVAATGIMAYSGIDNSVRLFAQEDVRSSAYGHTVNTTGYILPAVVAPGLYLIGLIAHDREVTGGGAAAVQALAITLGTTGILKWATGRFYPNNDLNDPSRLTRAQDAHAFHPFNFKGDYAWPSGHTASSISIAAALTAYYPDQIWVPLVGYPISLIIGIGMIDGDYHWASDVVAGALIGHAIGYTVGRNFRRSVREGKKDTGIDALTLRPLTGSTYGLAVAGAF